MSHDVQFEDVRRRVREFGDRATLVTVSPSAAPHVVTSLVDVRTDRLVVAVGARTRANLGAHPDVTLVWDPPGAGKYQLILDGVAAEVGAPDERGVADVSIRVTSGILHRLAGLTGPSCQSLDNSTE